jgi:benzil reductase ((S)-benzoin forming)
MLSKCIAEEQKHRPYPVKVAAIEPGMVETSMQALARSLPEEQFPMRSFFQTSFEEGKLDTPEAAAIRLLAQAGLT